MLKEMIMKEGDQTQANLDAVAQEFGTKVITVQYNQNVADVDEFIPLHYAQCPMKILWAKWMPSIALAASDTNYVTYTLGVMNMSTGAVAAPFDAPTTKSTGGAADAIGVTKSFTIVPTTDVLAAGETLGLALICAGTVPNIVAGTIQVCLEPIRA